MLMKSVKNLKFSVKREEVIIVLWKENNNFTYLIFFLVDQQGQCKLTNRLQGYC